MNQFPMHKSVFSAYEEMRSPFDVAADRRHPPVFCPKPRRLGQLIATDPFRRLRCYSTHQVDPSVPEAGVDLLDIFFSKGGEHDEAASSPPFFCGSPPSRAANPVALDERFGEDFPPGSLPPLPMVVPSTGAVGGSSPMSPRGVCVLNTAKFGLAPAAVRIEGFDCLGVRRQSCSSITAVA